MNRLCLDLEGRLIVSCQARPGDAFDDPESLARFADAAVAGGAAAIRADSARNIRAIRTRVSVPILGIYKSRAADGDILITPSFEAAREVVDAGASFIALDCTARGRRFGALDRLRRIKRELGVPLFADIATLDEGLAAAEAGADFVLTTMRGYTKETGHIRSLDLDFLRQMVRCSLVPVIAEGMIETPEQARDALLAGAFAVVVGKAITRPQSITERFVGSMNHPMLEKEP